MKKMLGTLGLMGLMGLLALKPINPIYAQPATDSARIAAHIDGALFFVNNEYDGAQLDGYTLPGFILRPHVAWRLDPRIKVEAGANWLHYWGNTGYPHGPLSEVMPRGGDTLSRLHLVPWLQARISLAQWLDVVLGSLENGDCHRLPLPLFNPERIYATDPEAGIQLLVSSHHLDVDAWVDWQQFIWHRSDHHERFVCGLTMMPRAQAGRWTFRLPLHAVVQHHGGEGIVDTTLGIITRFNLAAGINAAYATNNLALGLEAYGLVYMRNGAAEGELVYNDWGCLVEPPPAFKRGNGLWASLNATWQSTELKLSFWTGDKYIPLLGSYLFSNLSSNIDNMTHRRIEMLMVRGSHTWHFNASDLQLQGSYIHTFAHAADRLDYWPCSLRAENMFSFGLLLHLHPTIILRQ